MDTGEAIVVFDAACDGCSRAVRFIRDRHNGDRFTFVPLQSQMGRELLERNGIDSVHATTFLLIKGSHVYSRSEAVIEIAKECRGWRWLRVAAVVPRTARDWMYSVIARNRYKWFGRRDVCVMPSAEDACFPPICGAHHETGIVDQVSACGQKP